MKQFKKNLTLACLVGAAFTVSIASAQGIQVTRDAFVDTPVLSFAPPPGTKSATPPQPAPAVASSSSVKTWRVQSEDVRLSTTLERWTKEAGYNLIWDAQKQVLLSAKDSFSGTLEEALTRVLSSPAIRKSDYPLEACFYPNQPPVIRVTRLGEQAEECPQ